MTESVIIDVLCGDRCTCKLYADDFKLYTTLCVNDDIKHMQNRLNVLYTWSDTRQLNISTSKYAAMQIHAVTECSNLYLNNIAITKAHEFKDLASVRACLIRKCFVSKDVATLMRAFKTYVRPILKYASCVWSPTYTVAIKLIELVQRKFTRDCQATHT